MNNNIVNLLRNVESEIFALEMQHSKTVERNIHLFKILAQVKNDLEKTLKKPETLKSTVYNCIDILRENTPYYSTNEAKNKIDPPLADNEKTL